MRKSKNSEKVILNSWFNTQKAKIIIIRTLKFCFYVTAITIKTFWYIFQRVFLLWFLIFLTIWLAWWLSLKPSLYKDWSTDQSKLAQISFSWNIVSIKDIRNFRYKTTEEYSISYYDKDYDTDKIESAYYIIEPFSSMDWPAHTMLTFWFSTWSYITVSAEIRKEKWEKFDPISWILNQYEIAYMIWDEKDLIALRANYRNDKVIMYPVKASKEDIKALFISMMHRADKLSKEPEFYNTIWNTCMTNILLHVNSLKKEKIGWNSKILLPSHSDDIAYSLWLLDTQLPLYLAREYYTINELSIKAINDPLYSEKIRKPIK